MLIVKQVSYKQGRTNLQAHTTASYFLELYPVFVPYHLTYKTSSQQSDSFRIPAPAGSHTDFLIESIGIQFVPAFSSP